jgi:hypothetical protein
VNEDSDKAWEGTTWEGSLRAQLRHALGLSLRERFQAVEELADISRKFEEMRRSGKFVMPK